MAGVLIPPHAGVFSALGLLLAPPRSDVVRGQLLEFGDAGLDGALSEVVDSASHRLRVTTPVVGVESFADVRYRGQSHELSIPLRPTEGWDVLAQRFHAEHRRRNGFSRPEDAIEVVAVRAAAVGSPALVFSDLPEHEPSDGASRGTRPLLDGTTPVDAAVYWRPGLASGAEVVGPAIIEEAEATTFVGPGERVVVHPTGTLELEW
jgi:N-methylhydantoinase A